MKTNKIIKEQQGQNNFETQSNEVRDRLTGYVNKGCTPKGKVVKMQSTNPELTFAIKQESSKTPGKFRYLYDIKKDENTFEKRIAILNTEGKLVFSGTWYCDVDLAYTEKTDYERQKKTPQQTNAIKTYLAAGYMDIGGVLNPAESAKYNTIDMKDIYPDIFTDSYVLVQPIESVDTTQIITELNRLYNTKNFGDRKTCRQIIKNYSVAKLKEAPVDDAVLMKWKSAVNLCIKKVKNFNDLGITQNIISTLSGETDNQRWSITTTKSSNTTQQPSNVPSESPETPIQSPTNENYLKLKRIIRENLIELSETKKKSLNEELKIINSRFSVISESGKPKTKKQEKKFVNDLLDEMFYLKSQGFNDKLINEGFLDIIKGFFGNVPGGIFDTIKERLAELILEKLGVDTKGYLGNIFIATMGDIPIGDYVNGKVFNCEYLSNAISKGVGEGIARKIQKEQGGDGYMYDIIRNSLVDMFTDSSFGQKIEGAIGQLICPSLSKIKGKMDSAGETMKERALS